LSVFVLLVSVCQSLPLAGWIQSPGFPQGYGPDLSETWRRCAPPGYVLSLTMLHLDLEESDNCENDVLEISEDHNSIVKLCGQMTTKELRLSVDPLLRSSSGGCLSVTFRTDYSNTERHTGFKAFYTTQDVDECWENHVSCSHFCHNYIGGYSCSCKPGYYLNEDQHECHANCTEERYGSGLLTSPGSPSPYFENADCVFSLSVDEGNQVELKFIGTFDVESRDGQCIDFVEIKTATQTYGPFCGKKRPDDILTAAQHVSIIFHSDSGGINQGFSLEYKPKGRKKELLVVHLMECPGNISPHANVSPVRDRYTVGQSVTVRCLTGYILSDVTLFLFCTQATKSFTSTCQMNGSWLPKDKCEPVNCGCPELPELVKLKDTPSNYLYKNKLSVMCPSEFYKLEGKADFTCEATGEWMSVNGKTFIQDTPHCVPVCGITKESADGRIFGGQRAKLGQIPWQLLVKAPDRGGASLINDRWAITAAHVVKNKKSLIFFGGMVDGRDQKYVRMETEKIIIHPDFKPPNFDNDIALLKMSERVILSENIRPVCLPERQTNGLVMAGKIGTVSGFGATGKQNRSQYLQYGQVTEYSGVCFENESDLKVTENMFCAGGTEAKGVDSCKGDSGGPLFIPALGPIPPDTPYQIKGIVSWGPPVCGNNKGYYTKVENYLDWIRNTMIEN
ncbi:mannan-binding lectin serine protease 2 precursor, partial [Silurus meridionalis]